MLILGQFCGGLSTVAMGCGGDSWVVLSWWLDVCHLLLLYWVAMTVGKEKENLKGEREKIINY